MMRGLRQHTTAFVLAALAIVAVVFVLVVDKGTVTTAEAERRKKNLFDAWRVDEITDCTIVSGGKTVRLTRGAIDQAGQRPWNMETEGQTYAADEQAVDQFLGTLEFATYERRIADSAVDRAGASLDPPLASFAVRMGALRYDLRLGGPAPTPPGARYAEVSGRVFVVTAQLAAALDVQPERFRSRSIVPFLSTELERIELDGVGGRRHLTRGSWGGARGAGFRFDGSSPEGNVRADAVVLDRILQALGRMQAETFLDVPAAERVATRDVTLRLVPKDTAAKPGLIEIGGPCPGQPELVVAIRREPSPIAACIAKSALDALGVPGSELVDRHLIGASLDEITEVKLTAGARTIDIARAGAGWHQRAPDDRQVPPELGRSFVEGLLGLSAERFTAGEPSSLGLAPPHATVRIVSVVPSYGSDGGSDVERVEELAIGGEKEGRVVVRRAEDGAVALVSRADASSLSPSELALRPRKVIDESAKRFRSLRIKAGSIVQRLRRADDESWELVEPRAAGVAADIGLASDVVDVMSSLVADRWVAARDDGSYGLDKQRVTVEAELDSDSGAADAAAPSTLTITLGAPVGAGSFAKRSGDEAVFVAPKSLELVASQWLVNRMSLRIDPTQIAMATIEAGTKRVRLERSGEAFKIAGAPSDAASSERAATLRDALGGLIAETAVSIGKARADQGFDRPRLVITVERLGGEPKTVRLTVGAGDSWRGTSVDYVRREGIDATFAVTKAALRPLFDAL
jgi:hypothetical protein